MELRWKKRTVLAYEEVEQYLKMFKQELHDKSKTAGLCLQYMDYIDVLDVLLLPQELPTGICSLH